MKRVHIREAGTADGELLFAWANDMDVRRNAFSQHEISWEEHTAWLKGKLAAVGCYILIGFIYEEDMEERPIGQVRFDIDNTTAEIDYSVEARLRGQGYGTALLEAALAWMQDERRQAGEKISRFTALVKRSNPASGRVFEKCRFLKSEEEDCLVYEKAFTYADRQRPSVVICTHKSWNVTYAGELAERYQGEYDILVITEKEELTPGRLQEAAPQYVFFPHWSYVIPREIYEAFPCVVFHMTDLPYGRGGSPLQNLIVRGHTHTKLSALRVTKGMDTGDIYGKEDLDLQGTAGEILRRASGIIFSKMIPFILEYNPKPVPQSGEVVEFRRRKPEDGRLLPDMDEKTIYDRIRMLDGEGYPNAFVELGGYTLRFHNAVYQDGEVSAQVRFEKRTEQK